MIWWLTWRIDEKYSVKNTNLSFHMLLIENIFYEKKRTSVRKIIKLPTRFENHVLSHSINLIYPGKTDDWALGVNIKRNVISKSHLFKIKHIFNKTPWKFLAKDLNMNRVFPSMCQAWQIVFNSQHTKQKNLQRIWMFHWLTVLAKNKFLINSNMFLIFRILEKLVFFSYIQICNNRRNTKENVMKYKPNSWLQRD